MTIAPNRPDNAWYKRQYHVKVPRDAETRATLDTAYTSVSQTALAAAANSIAVRTVTFNWTGGVGPYTFDPGDGSASVSVSGLTRDHTYGAGGTYTATITDAFGAAVTSGATVV